MKVYLNRVEGIPAALTTLYFSKRSWSRGFEEHIYDVCDRVLDRRGFYIPPEQNQVASGQDYTEFDKWMKNIIKWGTSHITMLRFIDFSFTVEGLHRAGQDDWDAHAKRFENRILRASTRLGTFRGNEMSDWYKGRILTTDMVAQELGIFLPNIYIKDGVQYVRAENGYIRADIVGTREEQDTRRGLYMECIPSNFTYKVNLTEFSHVYKERNSTGTAHPEVKECCEASLDAIHEALPWVDRDLLLAIKN